MDSNNEGGPRATRVSIIALLSLCPGDGDGLNGTKNRGPTSKQLVRSMLGNGDGDGEGEVRGLAPGKATLLSHRKRFRVPMPP